MKVRTASIKEWEEFAQQSPGATFFHTFDWYHLWEQYQTVFKAEAKIFEFAGKAKALLPLLISPKAKGFFKKKESSPVGTYGAYLCKEELEESEREALGEYINRFSMAAIYENPFDRRLSSFIDWNKKDFTQVLMLNQPLAAICSTWSKAHQRSLKKALQSNLSIKIAEDQKEWEYYFQLYQESIDRWGAIALNAYEWSLFELLRLLPSENCRLWLAKDGEKIISGCLCFYWQRHVVYWHGASSAKAFEKRPVHLLHYRIIEDALSEGMDYYDFNPSGNLEGVIRFKEGFGTIRLDRNILEREPVGWSLLSQSYHKLWKS